MTKSMTEAADPASDTQRVHVDRLAAALAVGPWLTQPAATRPAAKRGHAERAAERSEAALIKLEDCSANSASCGSGRRARQVEISNPDHFHAVPA
jgi:hypothetical protein